MRIFLLLAALLFAVPAQAQLSVTGVGPGGFGGGYIANGVVFNGATQLTESADLTGVADGKAGTMSFWFWAKGGDGATQVYYDITKNNSGRILLLKNASNNLRVFGRNVADTVIIDYSTSTTYTTAMSAYAHVLAFWNLATGVCKIYVDEVDVTVGSTCTNDSINYKAVVLPENNFGNSSSTDSNQINSWIGEFYFDTTFIDGTTAPNRAKFASGGHPVNLGTNCATPTGSQPLVCFRGNASAFGTNGGSGGAFTTTGTITNAASNP